MKSWEHYAAKEDLLPNHVLIQRVARAAGVSTRSVHRAAKKRSRTEGKRDRRRLSGCPYTFVSLELWDSYMKKGEVERRAERPEGWLSVKALLEQGLGKRKLYERIHSGTIEAAYVGNTLYIEPEAADRLIEKQKDQRAPVGWLAVSELWRESGRSKQALSSYLQRNKVKIRYFLHKDRDQQVQYISVGDARAYLDKSGRGGFPPPPVTVSNKGLQSLSHEIVEEKA